MKIGEWYMQTFRDGDEIFFHPTHVLKNGNLAGPSYSLYIDRPRAKAKSKQISVHRTSEGLWRWIPPNEVPKDKFRE